MEKPMPVDPMPVDLTKRWVARFLDSLPFALVVAPICLLAQAKMIPMGVGIAVSVVMELAMFVYYVYMQNRDGQTLGKKHQKIKVCKLDGSPVRLQEVLSREIPILALALYSIIAHTLTPGRGYNVADVLMGVDMLCAAVRSDNRALHDLIAGTKVVAAPEVVLEKTNTVAESR
ncbi:TPA: hypothetical protein DDW35_08010 [Candidatus Sumerlaeota bacterium]|jgi:eukaryotic-like serine/threonine-protein kinase|nr:hypothetical protein [Candidatus Sumerlaeota bacterium]